MYPLESGATTLLQHWAGHPDQVLPYLCQRLCSAYSTLIKIAADSTQLVLHWLVATDNWIWLDSFSLTAEAALPVPLLTVGNGSNFSMTVCFIPAPHLFCSGMVADAFIYCVNVDLRSRSSKYLTTHSNAWAVFTFFLSSPHPKSFLS